MVTKVEKVLYTAVVTSTGGRDGKSVSSDGLLSANLFHRRIQDLMRTVTVLEEVPWSDQPRSYI